MSAKGMKPRKPNICEWPAKFDRVEGAASTASLNASMIDGIAKEMGGKDEFMAACRLSDVPKVREVVKLWEQLPKGARKTASLEELCKRAGVDPDLAIGVAVMAERRFQAMVAQCLNAEALPRIVECSIQRGLTPEGIRDRKLQFMIGGLLPPKAPHINVHIGGTRIDGSESFEEETLKSSRDGEFNLENDG